MKKFLKNFYILLGLILSINLKSLSMEWTPTPKAEKAKVESKSTSGLDSILKSSFFKELIKKTKEEKNQLLIETAKSKYFLDSKAQLLKIQLLIKAGADINARDHFGYTALMWATLNNSIKVVKLLLDEGAKVNIKNKGGYSVFAIVAISGNEAIGRLLADRARKQGLYKNLKNEYKKLAKAESVEQILIKLDELKSNCIKMLSKFNKDFCYLLHDNYFYKKIIKKIVKIYLKKTSEKEITLEFAKALEKKRDVIVETMLSAGVNPNKRLLFASSRNYIDIVKVLLAANAKPNIQNKYGSTALMAASTLGYTDLAKVLLDAGAKPNIQNGRGNTALIEASRENNIDVVKVLLAANAKPNIQNKYDSTALIETSREGNIDIVKALLDAGADPNIQDNYGDTALTLASFYGHTDIVKALLDADAKPNIQNGMGNTALIEASRRNYTDIVKILLDNSKTKPDIQNKSGYTALTLAKKLGRNEVVAILEEHIAKSEK